MAIQAESRRRSAIRRSIFTRTSAPRASTIIWASKDLLFAVYTVDDSAANTPSANPLSLVNESLREQVASVQEQHVFSPSLLNTARFGYSRASYFFTGHRPVSGTGMGERRSGRRHRHQRQHGFERRVDDYRRGRKHGQQQHDGAQSVH